jgi:hypothetical protein
VRDIFSEMANAIRSRYSDEELMPEEEKVEPEKSTTQ